MSRNYIDLDREFKDMMRKIHHRIVSVNIGVKNKKATIRLRSGASILIGNVDDINYLVTNYLGNK